MLSVISVRVVPAVLHLKECMFIALNITSTELISLKLSN